MSNEWIKTKAAKHAISYLADPRPAWVYSSVNGKLLWQNLAACLINAKQENNVLKLASNTYSLESQVEHILKLTPIGRSSLVRMHFYNNKTQFFLTCKITPLKGEDNDKNLLIIGVDTIELKLFEKYSKSEVVTDGLFGEEIDFLIIDENRQAIAGSKKKLKDFEQKKVDLENLNDDVLQFTLNEKNYSALLFPKAKKQKNNSATIKNDESVLWQITGKGFEAEKPSAKEKLKNKDKTSASYNFEELSRILLKKTSQEEADITSNFENETSKAKNDILNKTIEFAPNKKVNISSLANIPQETLVLNRLPIGLIIFRDQDIIFANRQIIKMTGHENLQDLINSGLASLFPAEKNMDNEPVGPITHLVKKNNSQIIVSARLQVITWQGKSAFLLSAKNEENNISSFDSAKFAAREFISNFAQIEQNGFFITNRSAVITKINDKTASLLNLTNDAIINHSLSNIIKPDNIGKLRLFLEQDAKSSQTKTPSILLETNVPALEILLFAEGHAGIVQSYAGLIREVKISPKIHKEHFLGIDPKILKIISRSMRRPLNTIIGFSEMISSQPLKTERYEEYAKDIKAAGDELTNVVGDLETIVKLKNVKADKTSSDFNLGFLLEKSIFRVKHLALKKQVLIRSSISNNLGDIKADKASLEQAILNLIASAIEQTPRGEQVVITASQVEDNMINVHVRNSGLFENNLSENFVVFRDGIDKNGNEIKPVTSSIGLSITRSLLAINSCTLELDPTGTNSTLFSLEIPASLKIKSNLENF